MLPPGIKEISDDSIVITREHLEHCRDNCKFAAKRAKEQGDDEGCSYYNGRAGVFDALLYMWEYKKNEEKI